jgi:hypothetical protein
MYDHVEPGTVIESDIWSSYRKLNNLYFGHENQIKSKSLLFR